MDAAAAARFEVTLDDHYRAADLLRPKAALLAARMLQRDAASPWIWQLVLRMVLGSRSRGAGRLTFVDFFIVASAEQRWWPYLLPLLSHSQREAWSYIANVKRDVEGLASSSTCTGVGPNAGAAGDQASHAGY